MTAGIKLFEEIIVGVLDNEEQVEEEKSKGEQVHPYAKHVTGLINHKVIGIPDNFRGTFILEESYYTYPGKEMEIKPLFFKVTPCGPYDIYLESIIVPVEMNKAEVVNSNKDLFFDFSKLQTNEKFGKAIYHYMEDHFIVNHMCDFGGGISFNLVETLKKGTLYVMETTRKDEQIITPYSTPIIYKRKSIEI